MQKTRTTLLTKEQHHELRIDGFPPSRRPARSICAGGFACPACLGQAIQLFPSSRPVVQSLAAATCACRAEEPGRQRNPARGMAVRTKKSLENTMSDHNNHAVLDSAHLGDIRGAFGTIARHDAGPRQGWAARLKTLLAILGPGLIIASN